MASAWACSDLGAFVSGAVEALTAFYLRHHCTRRAKARALSYVLDQRLEEGPVVNVLGFAHHMVPGVLLSYASGSAHR